jgi:uncharacterized membrane protein YeaQ/YmgE (transglycosylase-associated protein family)
VRGRGFGLFRDMVVGLAGAVIGGVLLHAFTRRSPTSPDLLEELLVAFAGAVILLVLGNLRSGRGWMRARPRSFF